MPPADRRLLRHLVIAVTLKLFALLLLWWLFFHPHPAAREDAATRTADHILGTSPRQGEPL